MSNARFVVRESLHSGCAIYDNLTTPPRIMLKAGYRTKALAYAATKMNEAVLSVQAIELMEGEAGLWRLAVQFLGDYYRNVEGE